LCSVLTVASSVEKKNRDDKKLSFFDQKLQFTVHILRHP
jgi:hypothetical protein